jgi:hypothetical protein
MNYVDQFIPVDSEEGFYNTNEVNKMGLDIKSIDRGYNKIWRSIYKNGKSRKTGIDLYTTGCCGSQIRDAESGEYYQHIVGTADEDLYFKVILATGECKSRNGSSTLFYLSPKHYITHFGLNENRFKDEFITEWDKRRDVRLATRQ